MFYFRRNLTDVTGSFSCGIVYSRGKRTPESEKTQMSPYLIKPTTKKKMFVYVPGAYISPFVLALEGGVNSNPSSREVFLEDGKSETGPKQLRTWLTRSLLSHTGDQARSVEKQRIDGRPSVSRPYFTQTIFKFPNRLFDIACLSEQSRNNDGHEGSSDGVLSDYPTVYCGI